MFARYPLPATDDGSAPPDTAADLQALKALKAHPVPGRPLTLLYMGPERTQIVPVDAAGAAPQAAPITLAMGTHRTARAFFRRDVPTPLELENAIASVEDEVYLAHQRYAQLPHAQGSMWWSTGAHLVALAELAGVPRAPAMVLTLEAMERLFQRLAFVSEGRPEASEGLPESVEFATTLLLLRELMHHMPFGELCLVR
ncbi:MAG: hypothetical protein V4679_15900 [Pseudomonadota bacterium]